MTENVEESDFSQTVLSGELPWSLLTHVTAFLDEVLVCLLFTSKHSPLVEPSLATTKAGCVEALAFWPWVQSDPVSLFPNPICTRIGLTCEPILPFHSALTPFQTLEMFPCLLELTRLNQLATDLRCCIQGRDEFTFWKTDIICLFIYFQIPDRVY